MRLNQKSASIVLVFIIAVSSVYAAFRFWGDPKVKPRPNLLIVSVCSLRYQLLKQYGVERGGVMPGLEDFFNSSSAYFTNMFNGMPWVSLYEYMKVRLPPSRMEQLGYKNHSNNKHGYTFRIPRRESWKAGDKLVDDNQFEKNIGEDLKHLPSAIRLARVAPFVMAVHIKYMHYPLIDRFNADAEWDYYLDQRQKDRVAELIKHPEKYPEKLPLLVMLNNDGSGARNHPLLSKAAWLKTEGWEKKARGLLTDPKILEYWQKSEGYEDDLEIMRKAYAGNARYLDKQIAPVLNLWDDPELRKNTMVVFTGDHGEMQMENGLLGHANSLRDEALRVPFAVRMPGEKGETKIIEGQSHFMQFTKLVEAFLMGIVKKKNLQKSLSKTRDKNFLLRNCQNSQRGLRFEGTYKYVYDVGSDESFLYDLLEDPKEQTNLADAKPELLSRMEKLFWNQYSNYAPVDAGDCRSNLSAAD